MIPSLALGKGIPKPDANGFYNAYDRLPDSEEYVEVFIPGNDQRDDRWMVAKCNRVIGCGERIWLPYPASGGRINRMLNSITHWRYLTRPEMER